MTFLIVVGWQTFESISNPAVGAIRQHPVPTTATVIEPEIDGPGGDPAVSYSYTAAGRTYRGYDVASKETGDVLSKKPGDPIPIQYAASMPEVSCIAGSTDCPNSVYDPYLFPFVFWSLAIFASIAVGVALAVRAIGRRLRASE